MFITIDKTQKVSLRKQVYDRIIEGILGGTISGGEKMPSTRRLSETIHVSRNIIIEVYEQLTAEGYLEGITGSGTFVAQNLVLKDSSPLLEKEIPVSEDLPLTDSVIDFVSGIPDTRDFPSKNWLSCQHTVERYNDPTLWGLCEIRGRRSLRLEIAQYLSRRNGIKASCDQIFIVSGVSQGIHLMAHLFMPEKPGVIMEDPVVWFVPGIFSKAGHPITPTPVDYEGIVPNLLPHNPSAGLLYLSPSHQFPLGGDLSIQKRIQILEYARKHDLYILEDDYDGEFRHQGAPVNSLCTLDPDRVIHLGTFSKNISPSLRLGYMVVPEGLVSRAAFIKENLNMRTPGFTQEVLREYISRGFFERRIMKHRKLYTHKMRTLTEELKSSLKDEIEIYGQTTGLHIALKFPGKRFYKSNREIFLKHGVRVYLLSEFYINPVEDPADTLVLGYGSLTTEEIRDGVKRIYEALQEIPD